MYTISEHFSNPFGGGSVHVFLMKNGKFLDSLSYTRECKYEADVCYTELEKRNNIKIPRPFQGPIIFEG